jgi:hypothetical protein
MNCVVEGLFQQDAFCPHSQLQHRIIVAFNDPAFPAAAVPLDALKNGLPSAHFMAEVTRSYPSLRVVSSPKARRFSEGG